MLKDPKIRDLETAKQCLQQAMTELEQVKLERDKALADLRRLVQQMEAMRAGFDQGYASWCREKDAMLQAISALEADGAAKLRAITQLEAERRAMLHDLQNFDAEKTGMLRAIEQLEAERVPLLQALESREAEKVDMLHTIRRLEAGAHLDSNADQSALLSKINSLEESMALISRELESEKAKSSSAVVILEKDNALMLRNCQELELETRSLKEALQLVKCENDALEHGVEQAGEKLAAATRAAEAGKELLRETIKNFEVEMTALQRDLNESTEALNKAQSELNLCQSRFSAAANDNERLHRELAELRPPRPVVMEPAEEGVDTENILVNVVDAAGKEVIRVSRGTRRSIERTLHPLLEPAPSSLVVLTARRLSELVNVEQGKAVMPPPRSRTVSFEREMGSDRSL